MFQKFLHYTTALVTLLAIAAVYLVTVDRWLQSPPVKPMVERDAPIVVHDDPKLADLFPASAWQRGECKHLKTDDGMLLFQHWQQTSENQWKLWPITVVVGRGLSSETAEMPILIESQQGAEIKFAQSLDIMSGDAPPIDGGQLIGDVSIRRSAAIQRPDPLAATKNQGDAVRQQDETFEVITSNVFIDSQKLWTTQAIQMRLGGARIRGQDLTLELNPGTTRPGAAPDAESLLRRMELIYLHEFLLPLDGPGLWQPAEDAQPLSQAQREQNAKEIARLAAGTEAPAGISVACNGTVQYDFPQHRLSLRDGVTLKHWVRNGRVDRFRCDSLRMTLREPMNRTMVREGPLDWIGEIHAEGSPLVATLQSFDCDFTAESILFHAANGEFRAAAEQGIGVRYGAMRGRIASLVYLFDPARPRRLGVIAVDGAGRMQGTSPDLPVREISWLDRLLVRNDHTGSASRQSQEPAATGRESETSLAERIRISVDGECRALFTDGGVFEGDSVEADLTRTPATASTSITEAGNPADGPKSNWNFQPERMTAQGRVRVSTAAIDARTDSLKLFFRQVAPPNAALASSDQGRSATDRSAAEGRVSQPADRTARSNGTHVARPRPTVRGKMVVAQISLFGREVAGRDMTVLGGVEMLHTVDAGGQTLPLKLKGQDLRMKEGTSEDEIFLRGRADQPARLDLGDGFFVGPEIHVLPKANFVEIDDAGEFQLPTALLPTAVADAQQDPTAKTLQWTQPPRCRWNESMVFDGQVARLSGGVRATASLVNDGEPWELYLNGEELLVQLRRDLQLRDAESMRGAEIHRVVVGGSQQRPVYLEAFRRAIDGALQARHVLHTPQLTYTPLDGGRVIGDGPGWYRVWLREALLSTDSPASRTSPEDTSDESQLTGVHMKFHESMVGDLQAQTLQFSRGVRLGTRAVSSWEEAFDAAKMSALAEGETTIDCERLRLQADPTRGVRGSRQRLGGQSAPWELLVDGGVVFRTCNDRGLYEGTASQATYASAKDLFRIVGAPGRSAVLKHTLPTGDPNYRFVLRSAVIRPHDMVLEDAELEGVTSGAFPGGTRR